MMAITSSKCDDKCMNVDEDERLKVKNHEHFRAKVD